MTAAEVLAFWFGQPSATQPRAEWFRKDPAFDDLIRQRFGDTIEKALAGGLQPLRPALHLLVHRTHKPRAPRRRFAGCRDGGLSKRQVQSRLQRSKRLPLQRQAARRTAQTLAQGIQPLCLRVQVAAHAPLQGRGRSVELRQRFGLRRRGQAVPAQVALDRFGSQVRRIERLATPLHPQTASFSDGLASSERSARTRRCSASATRPGAG